MKCVVSMSISAAVWSIDGHTRWSWLRPPTLCCFSPSCAIPADNVFGLLPITAVKKASVWLMIVHQVPPLGVDAITCANSASHQPK
jgi:hypothetical protein